MLWWCRAVPMQIPDSCLILRAATVMLNINDNPSRKARKIYRYMCVYMQGKEFLLINRKRKRSKWFGRMRRARNRNINRTLQGSPIQKPSFPQKQHARMDKLETNAFPLDKQFPNLMSTRPCCDAAGQKSPSHSSGSLSAQCSSWWHLAPHSPVVSTGAALNMTLALPLNSCPCRSSAFASSSFPPWSGTILVPGTSNRTLHRVPWSMWQRCCRRLYRCYRIGHCSCLAYRMSVRRRV